jgi:hypothetical protein
MRHQRERTFRREAQRKHDKRFSKLRRAAADLRIQHNRCLCADDERHYTSEAAAAADKSPALTCPDCGLSRLLVPIITNRPLDERERLLLQGLLR